VDGGSWQLELMGVGVLPPMFLERTATQLARRLGQQVEIYPGRPDPAAAFDVARQQYLVTALLAMVEEPTPRAAVKRIAVTGVDLYLPVFTHVVGFAELGGRVGIVSTFRLRGETAGGRSGQEVLIDRVEKEVLHEMGHTLGLVHCRQGWCVMRPSGSPEELDSRDAAFCATCAERIHVTAFATSDVLSWRSEGR